MEFEGTTMYRKIAYSAIATLIVGACQSDAPDDQERLQELLHDAPLTHLPAATSVSDPGDVGSTGKTGIHSDSSLATVNALGVWNFDDCTSFRTNLSDSSFNNSTAFRSVGVSCTDGIRNTQAVAIAVPEDIVYVPDQPNFT